MSARDNNRRTIPIPSVGSPLVVVTLPVALLVVTLLNNSAGVINGLLYDGQAVTGNDRAAFSLAASQTLQLLFTDDGMPFENGITVVLSAGGLLGYCLVEDL